MTKINKLKDEIYHEINLRIETFGGIPSYLTPKINEPNDFAYPYIDIGDDGILYIVIRERGIELQRSMYPNIDYLLKEIFSMIAYQLATKEILQSTSEYNHKEVEKIQKRLLKKFKSDWDI